MLKIFMYSRGEGVPVQFGIKIVFFGSHTQFMQLIGVNLGAAIQGNANIIEVLEEFGREFKTIVAKAFGKNLPVAESFFGHIACVGRSLAVCPDLKCPNAQSFPQFF